MNSNTNSSEIKAKVASIVAEQLGLDISDVHDDSRFIDDLGADSLDVVELIMSLEDEFSLQIPDEDAEKMIKVSDVVDYISKSSI